MQYHLLKERMDYKYLLDKTMAIQLLMDNNDLVRIYFLHLLSHLMGLV
jgi:hypothetical protein